ncbi:MAG: hypothetical protein A3E36_03575 [Candidatus Andersenbacteria bacterium RIFCSPHIGHO2_12_FULL_45_11b]|uniref:Uncharacterized protein n=1 Tax=Candidatus Andersenbacteria bacterium RIFCSPHIGHO2_12_FULL_45_11b TaxID=1797282 RepID=A0A1G1X7A8_9BACT|nr:MAG: hypothetical protein A3E36_03575 [Candidatus Andersenbacteria bacterium RIFCSPHIGHO2_12_FULL_45_11b]
MLLDHIMAGGEVLGRETIKAAIRVATTEFRAISFPDTTSKEFIGRALLFGEVIARIKINAARIDFVLEEDADWQAVSTLFADCSAIAKRLAEESGQFPFQAQLMNRLFNADLVNTKGELVVRR